MHAPIFRDFDSYRAAFSRVLSHVAESVPQLRDRAMLHGTAAGSLGGLRHRESWDLDLMGQQFGCSVADLANQMERRLRGQLRWDSREEETSMFMGRLALPDLPEIDVQLFSNVHESIDFRPSPEEDFGGMPVICVDDYAEMKAQSLLERNQPKDLRDFAACFNRDITSYAARRAINRFSAGSLQRILAKTQRTSSERLLRAAPGFNPTTVEDLANLAEHCDIRIQKLKLVAMHRRACPAF